MAKEKVAAMSLKGTGGGNAYLALMEYYEQEKRWFLAELFPVKELSSSLYSPAIPYTPVEYEEERIDESVIHWVYEKKIQQLILDHPLSPPWQAQDDSLIWAQGRIKEWLEQDQKLVQEQPKKYEYDRNQKDQMQFWEKKLAASVESFPLSRSFKRRLKKGVTPYGHRPIDLWLWEEYYDSLMIFLKTSYDSFGQTSLSFQHRFFYWQEKWPSSLSLYESYPPLVLLELLRAKIIQVSHLTRLLNFDEVAQGRAEIIAEIERSLKFFLYDHDIRLMTKDAKAFHSFLLAVVGVQLRSKKIRPLPTWPAMNQSQFIIPDFDCKERSLSLE